MLWFFGKSKATEQRRRAVQAYVLASSAEPDEPDVQWLATIAGDGDVDRARWELRYARRAVALLVAERDALDDRTGSLVAREMRQALQMDRGVAAGMVAVAELWYRELSDLYVVIALGGTIALTAGAGFIISAVISYKLLKAWGLLPGLGKERAEADRQPL